MPELERGLVIIAAGLGGVFVNLLVLMVAVILIGKIFGKKPKKKADKKPKKKKKADVPDVPAAGEAEATASPVSVAGEPADGADPARRESDSPTEEG